jgi:hypothetical protein
VRPSLILRSLYIIGVLRTVKFDYKARSHAGKIGHIGSNRHLAAKMRSFRLNAAKPLP